MAEVREAVAKREGADVSRRGFLGWMLAAWSSILIFTAWVIGWSGQFMRPRLIYELSPRFKAGFPDDYPLGTVSLIPGRRVWIVHYQEGFQAIQAICTHLGCQPNWIEAEGIFRCPCHGSTFDRYGANIGGPAPYPLRRPALEVAPDGRFAVDMSRLKAPKNLAEAHDTSLFIQPESTSKG